MRWQVVSERRACRTFDHPPPRCTPIHRAMPDRKDRDRRPHRDRTKRLNLLDLDRPPGARPPPARRAAAQGHQPDRQTDIIDIHYLRVCARTAPMNYCQNYPDCLSPAETGAFKCQANCLATVRSTVRRSLFSLARSPSHLPDRPNLTVNLTVARTVELTVARAAIRHRERPAGR